VVGVGETNMKDEYCCGRPSTVVTEASVEKAVELLKKDQKLSLQDSSFSSRISTEETHHITTDCPRIRHICAI
jgi:hypothetical protein